MPLQQGNVTLKLSGGSYSTWAGFWNDLGNLTGDITCTVDASAFTENTAPAAVTETLGGYTLHVCPVTFPTTTDATTGARFTLNYSDEFLYNQMEGPGTVIIEGIVVINPTATTDYISSFRWDSIGTGFTAIMRRNIIKYGSSCFRINETSPTYYIYNNIIYSQGQTALCRGVYLVDASLSGYISNNTIVDVAGSSTGYGFYLLNNASGLFENNLVYNSKTTDYYQVTANATGNNNSSYDATADDFHAGADNRINKTTSPFTNYAGDDFTLAAASDPIGNGKDLSAFFTTDFFGVTRDTWDIGACAYVAAGGTEYFATITDSISMTDTLTKSSSISYIDSVSLSDILSQFAALTRQDSITLTESLSQSASITKQDNVSFADSLIKDIEILFLDNIAISDSLSALLAYVATITDTITISDEALTQAVSIIKSDTLAILDSLTKQIGITIADGFSVTDSLSAFLGYLLTLSDTISLSDSINLAVSLTKQDSFTIAENLSKAIGITIEDAISITDSLSALLVYLLTLSADTIAISDTQPTLSIASIIEDSFSISEQLSKSLSITLEDAITLTDSLTSFLIYLLTVTDTITITDSISTKAINITKSDTFSMLDSISKSVEITVADTISLTDIISLFMRLNIADSITMTDSLTATHVVITSQVFRISFNVKKSQGIDTRKRSQSIITKKISQTDIDEF